MSGPAGERVNVPPFEYEVMQFQQYVAQNLKDRISALRLSQVEVWPTFVCNLLIIFRTLCKLISIL